jgi:hypothetical protein
VAANPHLGSPAAENENRFTGKTLQIGFAQKVRE